MNHVPSAEKLGDVTGSHRNHRDSSGSGDLGLGCPLPMFKVNRGLLPNQPVPFGFRVFHFLTLLHLPRARLSLVRRLQRSSHICEEIEIQATVNQEDTGQRKGKCQESYPKKRGGSKMPQLRPEF